MVMDADTEYAGLAATVGRLMAALKQTEAQLTAVTEERDKLLAAKNPKET